MYCMPERTKVIAEAAAANQSSASKPPSTGKYEELLEQALDQAHEFHGEDLFACMDRLYKSSKQNKYIPGSELARLVNAPPALAKSSQSLCCGGALDACIRALARCFGAGYAGRDPNLAEKIIQEFHRTKHVWLVPGGDEQPTSAMLDFYC